MVQLVSNGSLSLRYERGVCTCDGINIKMYHVEYVCVKFTLSDEFISEVN